MEKYDPDDNPGFSRDDPRLTDFRWRRVAVSSEQLSAMVRGERMPRADGVVIPADLIVIGLTQVTTGGWWELIVWSTTFLPIPNDGKWRMGEIPLVEF